MMRLLVSEIRRERVLMLRLLVSRIKRRGLKGW